MVHHINDFRVQNKLHSAILWLQIVLMILGLIQLNYIAMHYVLRKDMTLNHRYSLSAETLAYIGKIDTPIEIIVTLTPLNDQPELKGIYQDLERLLREYTIASYEHGNPKIRVQYVDIYQQRKLTEALKTQYNIQKEHTIVVACADNYQHVSPTDLYQGELGEIKYFVGETAITSAIATVIDHTHPKIYFTEGHGELQLASHNAHKGLSQAEELLKQRHIQAEQVLLSSLEKIPMDAACVVVAGPQAAFTQSEVNKLQRYLEQAHGTVFIFLEPGKAHGLEDLFFHWGILADNWIIVDPAGTSQSSSGDYIIRRFAEHPITQFLIDYQLTVVAGLCRPIRLDLGASFDEHREVSPLMASSNESWAERNFDPYICAKFDPLHDLHGPLSIAVVSEHALGSQIGLQVPGSRLVVFGSADIISNHHLKLLGNESLFLNAMLWGVRRENLVSVLPKAIEAYQLSLSRTQLGAFGLRLLILPTLLAIIGVIVFLKRRR